MRAVKSILRYSVAVFLALPSWPSGIACVQGVRSPTVQPLGPSLPGGRRAATLNPSTTVKYAYPVNSSNIITAASNSDGFRNPREFDEPDSRPRVWLLGDSMVLGEGVEAEDRLTEVIGRLEPGWRVDNLGMSGWGLDLMVRAFEKVSRRVMPDVTVLAFYTDDFRRLRPRYTGMGYALPRFELADGALIVCPRPVRCQPGGGCAVQAVEQTYWRFARNQCELNGALLDRLKGQSGGPVPAPRGVRARRAGYRGSASAWFPERRWCQRNTIPYLDRRRR